MEIYDNFLQSTTCNSCNKFSLLLDYKTSDIVCSNCGLVMYDRLASSESEEIVYQEDRESGAYSSRMSSQAESKLGAFNTIFQPNLSSSYTKVTKKMASELTSIQMRTNSPQELRAISYIVQIRAMCGKLDLNSSPQVAVSYYILLFIFLFIIIFSNFIFLFIIGHCHRYLFKTYFISIFSNL